MFDDLEKDIRICLSTQPTPLRNRYAGKSPGTRGRTGLATKLLAEAITVSIGRTYRFYEGERRVDVFDVAIFLEDVLSAVPEERRERYADKLSINSDAAKIEIAESVVKALEEKWVYCYRPANAPHH
ncbi:hypothetical protein [Rhizobium sp. RM]|uniref:hypothetical protein n=1 Tax=Rhizobium sp. RM TaxID=2748079 RepID=UPI0015B46B23|nr:hypothetical protein [Rhizobium sp. RM]NWJ27468.1 hypothetical protein [Rhizobium sp. RM]TMV18615.1 hypothetical protein BJG94_15145 [Rhizobium sp. Td3]